MARERLIGALKAHSGRLAVSAMPGRDWTRRIEAAVRRHNSTVHSRTGFAPNDVSADNANVVFRRLYRSFSGLTRNWQRKILPIGTLVRLRLTNRGSTFSKASQPKNSAEVYKIFKIRIHSRLQIAYKLCTVENETPVMGLYGAGELVRVGQ